MKRLLLLFIFLPFFAQSQIKVSEMTSATSLNDADNLLVVQSGSSKKVAFSVIDDEITDTLRYYTTISDSDDSLAVIRGEMVSLGTDNQIPFTNSGGTDFDYTSNFKFNSGVLNITDSRFNIVIANTTSPVGVLATENTIIGYNASGSLTGAENVVIGSESGFTLTTGGNNTLIGTSAFKSNEIGSNNTGLGFESGLNTTGSNNVFLGYKAGYNETGSNKLYIANSATDTLIYGDFTNETLLFNADLIIDGNITADNITAVSGTQYQIPYLNLAGTGLDAGSGFTWDEATLKVNDGNDNIFIGDSSGVSYTSGDQNVFVGYKSGILNEDGEKNTFIGYKAGFSNVSGTQNTYIGDEAGLNSDGEQNTFIGVDAGVNFSGSSSIFIGRSAGSNALGSSKLYIEPTASATPLIYGDFAADSVTINGKLSSKLYTGQLYIDGDSVIIVAAIGTYQTVDKFQTDGFHNTTLTDSTITISADGGGCYVTSQSMSFTHATNSTIVHMSVFINDIEDTRIEIERKIGNGGDVGATSNTGILDLLPGDVVKIKVKATSTGNLTITHANFNIHRLN